jgi:hypothetical protein
MLNSSEAPTTEKVDTSLDEIERVQKALMDSLKSPASYESYCALISLFQAGRLGKIELESSLRTLLGHSIELFDLHNKHVGLVLSRLAAIESEALRQWQPSSGATGTGRRGYFSSAASFNLPLATPSLQLGAIELTPADEQIFKEAVGRSPVAMPSGWDDRVPLGGAAAPGAIGGVGEEEDPCARFQIELSGMEKALGRPLLAAISRTLPDELALRSLLTSWMRVYQLDSNSIEDEHIGLLQQGLYDYLDQFLMRLQDIFGAESREEGKEGVKPVVTITESLLESSL